MTQPVLVPLQSTPALQQINTLAQLGVTHEFTNDRFNILIDDLDEGIEQGWAQH